MTSTSVQIVYLAAVMKESNKISLLSSGLRLLLTGNLLVGVVLLLFLLFESISYKITWLIFIFVLAMEIVGIALVTKADNMK